jgi:hypothetical protein
MKQILLIAAISVALTFSGCIPTYHTVNKKNIHPDVPVVIKNYELGKEFTANVGNIIISGERALKDTSLTIWRAINDFQSPAYANEYKKGKPGDYITTSQMYIEIGETNISNKKGLVITDLFTNVLSNIVTNDNSDLLISINEDGSVQHGYMINYKGYLKYIDNNIGLFRGYLILEQGRWAEGKLFEKYKPTKEITEPSDFKFTLTYLGKDNDVIRLKYMEYVKDIPRPAFSNDIFWDLKETDIMSYKSIKAKIISATGNQIKLVVLEDDDLGWLPFD